MNLNWTMVKGLSSAEIKNLIVSFWDENHTVYYFKKLTKILINCPLIEVEVIIRVSND